MWDTAIESIMKFCRGVSITHFKATKWACCGIKYNKLCKSSSGYCVQFRTYSGLNSTVVPFPYNRKRWQFIYKDLTYSSCWIKYTTPTRNILRMYSFVSECSLEYGTLLINQVKGRLFTTAFISIYWYLCHWSPANCYGIGGNRFESNEFCLSNVTASILQIPSVLWNSQLWPVCVQNLMKSL